MGDIAKHAGVGKGTLYRHFPDKEALLIEVIRTRFDEFYEIASRGRGRLQWPHRGRGKASQRRNR